ncbi:hypothetical protein [Faucicola boevrei]|uniref:hypothetical protein n=1 Tax=Faucicola boevrei TaxID=346665 RepID=UPI000380ACE7|nr:hypothetical protein [Moraxella boevrei]
MPYISQTHSFLIDDAYSADVFGELETFFSAYSSDINQLPRLSIGLSVPSEFDINADNERSQAYRQFCQMVRYIVPDVNILPFKIHQKSKNSLSNDVIELSETVAENDYQAVILLIQYFQDEMAEKSASKGFFTKIFPTFIGKKSETGLHPNPTPQPKSQPRPQPIPKVQPQPQATIKPSLKPQNPMGNQSQSYRQSATAKPQPMPKTAVQKLPSINQRMQPYYQLLVSQICQAVRATDTANEQMISKIVLRPQSGLSRAFIEQVFNSFHQRNTADSLDMPSFGLEWLKPALAKKAIMITDDLQFELKTKAKTTSHDIAQLSNGDVNAEDIQILVDFIQ